MRITVEFVAGGERKLHRLGDRVDVLGRVVAHALEVIALQDRERLEEDRSLTPESGLEDLERAVSGLEAPMGRLLQAALVVREIRLCHEAACGLNRLRDPSADVATIEAVARGIDGCLATPLGVLLLGLDERAQCPREVRLTKDASDVGNRSARSLKVHTRPTREGCHALQLGTQVDGEEVVPREPVRELDRRGERVDERKSAELG